MSDAHREPAPPDPAPALFRLQRAGVLLPVTMCKLSCACSGLRVSPGDHLLAQQVLGEQSLPGYPLSANVARTLNWAARVGAVAVWRWLALAHPRVSSDELNTCLVLAAHAGHDSMLDMLLAHASASGVRVPVPVENLHRATELLMERDRARGRAFVSRHDLPARIGSPTGRYLVLYANDLFADVLLLSTWVVTLFHVLRSVPERVQAVQSASPRLLERWVAHAQGCLPELEYRFEHKAQFGMAWLRVMGESSIDVEACMRAARHLSAGRVLEAVRAWPARSDARAREEAQSQAQAQEQARCWRWYFQNARRQES